ncbi:hypothetical protein [Pseudovibrio sp. Ad26]|uniref:hypothetical protein n=1 Tax=Pseudovibrio sp. Ad26 TaxID=989410 RepID=UPI0007AE462A|nr:hypothetical protein [Pseudovibrio sp. Ad26]KZL05999.1 hypothetical protein PsAD26_04145 [Pseudovibrio sp. Ad26]
MYFSSIIGGIIGALVGVIVLAFLIASDWRTTLEISSLAATVSIPFITIMGFVFLRRQVKAANIGNSISLTTQTREAAYNIQKEIECVAWFLREEVQADRLVKLLIKAMEIRHKDIENSVRSRSYLWRMDDALDRLKDSLSPSIKYLDKEAISLREQFRLTMDEYLSDGLGAPMQSYMKAISTSDLKVIEKLVVDLKRYEGNVPINIAKKRVQQEYNTVQLAAKYLHKLNKLKADYEEDLSEFKRIAGIQIKMH